MIRIRVLGTRIDTDVHRNDLAKAPGSKLALAAQQVPPGDGTVTVNDWRNPSYDVLMVVRGCYTGVRPKFNATQSPAVLRGLDFFKIPQEIRPAGLVLQAQLQEKYTGTLQQATQLIEAAQTDIVRAMTPDDNGMATTKLFLCRSEGKELHLEVLDPPSEAQGFEEYLSMFQYLQPNDIIEADSWLSNLLKRAAEGCGFKASLKRVRTERGDPTFCTCLNLSLEISEANVHVY